MLDEQQKKRLAELYPYGMFTHEELAKLLDVDKIQVYDFYHRHKEKYNFPKTKKKIQSLLIKNVDEAYKLYQEGNSLRKVGEYFNVSNEYVRQVFEKFNLAMRSAGTCRIYLVCAEGHELEKGEYPHTCSRCSKIKKENRRLGKHLKTYCKYGHEFKGHNLMIVKRPNGKPQRRCRTCVNGYAKKCKNNA